MGFVEACCCPGYLSIPEASDSPGNALCLGCGQIFPRVFFTVCTLLGLGSSWVVRARSLLCVVLQRESICCDSPSDGPLSLSLNVYQHGVGEMGKPQSQAGTVKVVLGDGISKCSFNSFSCDAGSSTFSWPSPGREIHFCPSLLPAAGSFH